MPSNFLQLLCNNWSVAFLAHRFDALFTWSTWEIATLHISPAPPPLPRSINDHQPACLSPRNRTFLAIAANYSSVRLFNYSECNSLDPLMIYKHLSYREYSRNLQILRQANANKVPPFVRPPTNCIPRYCNHHHPAIYNLTWSSYWNNARLLSSTLTFFISRLFFFLNVFIVFARNNNQGEIRHPPAESRRQSLQNRCSAARPEPQEGPYIFVVIGKKFTQTRVSRSRQLNECCANWKTSVNS